VQTLGTRQVYANNWMTVREDAIRLADGTESIYGVVDKPTFALVVPRDGDRLHLVEQFRYPVGRRRWEFPMGTAPERAEVDPAELAARELREETGLEAAVGEIAGVVERIAEGYHYLIVDLWAELADDAAPVAAADAAGARLVPLDELPEYPLSPGLAGFLAGIGCWPEGAAVPDDLPGSSG